MTDTSSRAVPGRPVTPGSWRAIALGVLGGGFLVGYRAAGGDRLSGLLAALGAAGAAGAAVPIALASRRPDPFVDPPKSEGIESVTTFSVVVAARDEVEVLPRLVRDLAAQEYRAADGRPLFELILIDDRSIDGTAQAALRAAAAGGLSDVTRSIRRGATEHLADEPLADGKGAALTAAQPDVCHGDVVVVLDADARVGPRFLSTLARYFDAGADAVTPRRRILDADSSWLAGAQADEQTADGEIQRGRWFLGGCSEFRGNGISIRRALLAEVGGWRAEALTEDLDLSSRVAAQCGVTVAWALDAEVWEEPVGSWDALWKQRVRWAEGGVRRLIEHGPAVLSSRRLSTTAKLYFAAYTSQLLVPPVIIGAVTRSWRTGRGGLARRLLASYMLVGAGAAFDALRWETDRGGASLLRVERLRRSLRAALFGALWLAAIPAAMWRLAMREGPVRYEKMDHSGSRRESRLD
jgi:1,2-diacylglycerol 3-beta-glucosyltransferase